MMKPPEGPYPSVGGAMMLTLMALFAAGFTGMAFIDFGLLAAVGIGQAIGVGAVATMGAQRVAEPQAARLGLRGLDPQAIPMILCLVPAILLASELDNWAADWSGAGGRAATPSIGFDAPPDGSTDDGPSDDSASYDVVFESQSEAATQEALLAQEASGSVSGDITNEGGEEAPDEEAPTRLIDPEDPASVMQAFLVIVGISPVVEEFLFRGVIQQGLVQRLGLLRGLSVVALLWTLLRPAPIAGFPRFLAAALASFALGWALGLVRIATGSILGPILLASSWAAIGLFATVYEGRIDLPGMNVDGTHLPVMVTLSSLGIVAWAGWSIFVEAQSRLAAGEGISRTDDEQPPGEDGVR